MKTLFTILFSLIVTSVFGQAPAIQWQKCFGGTISDDAKDIKQTTDGGFIVTGHSSYNYWSIKINSAGFIEWQSSLGGGDVDQAQAIQQTSDSGYIMAGWTASNNGDVTGHHSTTTATYDYWVVKLNSVGVIQWQKCLGGTRDDQAFDIRQTADNGYIVVGSSNSIDGDITSNHGQQDYWVVKLDSTGIIQWEKSLGGSMEDKATAVQQTFDGGYVVTGSSFSQNGNVTGNHGLSDYWVVKLDSSGVLQWQKSLGGTGMDASFSILQTTDSGYVIAGSTGSVNGDVSGNIGGYNGWIVKLRSNGTIEWRKTLGGIYNTGAFDIQSTIDGGFVVAGAQSINVGHFDYWLAKLDSIANLQWQKSFGGTSDDHAYAVQQTTTGEYIVAGSSYSNDGDVSGNHGSSDYWVVKLGPDPAAVSNTSFSQLLSLHPNPATTELHVQSPEPIRSLTVSDLTGRIVYQADQLASIEAVVPTATLPDGFYLLQAITGNGTSTHKFQVRH